MGKGRAMTGVLGTGRSNAELCISGALLDDGMDVEGCDSAESEASSAERVRDGADRDEGISNAGGSGGIKVDDKWLPR